MNKKQLIQGLVDSGWLKTSEIIEAFQRIDRKDFVPKDMEGLAYINEALPIGYGQTISQPLVVAFMLELLQPGLGNKILDVGSGSAWTTALLAYIVSQAKNLKRKAQNQSTKLKTGRVIGLEIMPELVEFGRKNLARYNFINKGVAEILQGDGSRGHLTEVPYDKILVSAAALKEAPPALKNQLKIGGRLVLPIGDSIWLYIKIGQKDFKKEEHPGFVFVPLVEK